MTAPTVTVLHLFHLLVGDIQGMAEMGIGVGLVARLLGDALDIFLVELLQPRQPKLVESDAGQHESAGPIHIRHGVSP